MLKTWEPKKRYVPKNKKEEETIQRRLCRYIRENYPHAVVYSDYAAGINLTDNQRMIMMSLRSHDGMPDLYVDYPMTHTISGKQVTFHGLRLELKKEGTVIYKKDGRTLRKAPYTRRYRRNGKLFVKRGDHLAEQAATLRKYNEIGYLARFAIGYDQAVKIIDWYFKKPQNEAMF